MTVITLPVDTASGRRGRVRQHAGRSVPPRGRPGSPRLAAGSRQRPTHTGAAAGTTPTAARWRLTRRGRLAIVAAVLGAASSTFLLVRAPIAVEPQPPRRPAVVSVTVAPGETLWQIASRIDPGRDPRETIGRIQRLNHLPGSQVQAGQSLLVPR